jgi:GGDEF domain-containing protein
MFDIDHFKKINDSFGHLAGDYVLKHLAQTVKTRIRREDCFARYGGEEFAIVLRRSTASTPSRSQRRSASSSRPRLQVREHLDAGHDLDGQSRRSTRVDRRRRPRQARRRSASTKPSKRSYRVCA